MVVICAAILSKTATLLSRQFVSINRLRLEALLSNFLTLIDTQGDERTKTAIESDGVRYLFVPVESFYILIVTDTASNIISDAETLNILQQLVVELCGGQVTTESIARGAFDLIFGMDELIGTQGLKEYVSVGSIKEYLSMESTEEKLQQLIQRSKEAEENERRRKKAIELDREKLKRLEQSALHAS